MIASETFGRVEVGKSWPMNSLEDLRFAKWFPVKQLDARSFLRSWNIFVLLGHSALPPLLACLLAPVCRANAKYSMT